MSAPGSFPPSAGRPFTVWLDPARWPKAPLRLPGKVFTLWTNPAVWPASTLRLPGHAHTLWLDPARWPQPRLRLPGLGFTLWLNPETWPRPAEFSLPAPLPPLPMPINIPQNKAFTLWTRPSQVTPIPMKNGLTAAQVAAASEPLVVSPPAASPRESPATPVTAAPVPFAHRLMPLAAALVAVLGLNALISAADSKKSSAAEADRSREKAEVRKIGEDVKTLEVNLKEAAAQIQAKNLVLKTENDRLVTDFTQAQETIRKATGRTADLENLVRDLTKVADEAKTAASNADTKAQSMVVAAMEEASVIKRESAAEVVKLRESLARMEAEKAAALKAAATAEQEKAALQQALDGLKKPAP